MAEIGMGGTFRRVVFDTLRFLCFRPVQFEPELYRSYLAFGLISAWLCGIGRYWDNPRAELWQHLGLGSVAYVFVLAALLWLIIWPLRPERWRFCTVLLFVALTSPPAILYAVPVERYLTLEAAQQANIWFLAIVASWRVALLYRFLRTAAGLPAHLSIVATLLPLTLIVSALSMLNLEHVVFRIMAGLEDHERSVHDGAYVVLLVISYFSLLLFPVLTIIYAAQIYLRRRRRQAPRK